MAKRGRSNKKAAATSKIQRSAQESSPEGTAEPAAAEQCEIAVPGDEEEPEPFSEEASEVVEPVAAEECDATIPDSEEIEAPEPISEEGSEVVEPATAEECEASGVSTTVGTPGITEYVQPVDRYVTPHIR